MDGLIFYTNASVMNSEVDVNGVKRQLQGQSNYMINSGDEHQQEK
jgi:hypothetical protein